MAGEVEELRRKLDNLPRVGKRRIYTAALKRRVLETVDAMVADGMKQAHACEALGIHQGTVADWKRGGRRMRSTSKKRSRVVPVEVAATSPAAELTMVLPGGIRVEGLKVDQLIELTKALQ